LLLHAVDVRSDDGEVLLHSSFSVTRLNMMNFFYLGSG
jgi:hypothetical protein